MRYETQSEIVVDVMGGCPFLRGSFIGGSTVASYFCSMQQILSGAVGCFMKQSRDTNKAESNYHCISVMY